MAVVIRDEVRQQFEKSLKAARLPPGKPDRSWLYTGLVLMLTVIALVRYTYHRWHPEQAWALLPFTPMSVNFCLNSAPDGTHSVLLTGLPGDLLMTAAFGLAGVSLCVRSTRPTVSRRLVQVAVAAALVDVTLLGSWIEDAVLDPSQWQEEVLPCDPGADAITTGVDRLRFERAVYDAWLLIVVALTESLHHPPSEKVRGVPRTGASRGVAAQAKLAACVGAIVVGGAYVTFILLSETGSHELYLAAYLPWWLLPLAMLSLLPRGNLRWVGYTAAGLALSCAVSGWAATATLKNEIGVYDLSPTSTSSSPVWAKRPASDSQDVALTSQQRQFAAAAVVVLLLVGGRSLISRMRPDRQLGDRVAVLVGTPTAAWSGVEPVLWQRGWHTDAGTDAALRHYRQLGYVLELQPRGDGLTSIQLRVRHESDEGSRAARHNLVHHVALGPLPDFLDRVQITIEDYASAPRWTGHDEFYPDRAEPVDAGTVIGARRTVPGPRRRSISPLRRHLTIRPARRRGAARVKVAMPEPVPSHTARRRQLRARRSSPVVRPPRRQRDSHPE